MEFVVKNKKNTHTLSFFFTLYNNLCKLCAKVMIVLNGHLSTGCWFQMSIQGLRRTQLSVSTSSDEEEEEEEDLPFTFFEEDLQENFEDRSSRRPENPLHKLLNKVEHNEDSNEESFRNKRTRSNDSTGNGQILTSSGERWEFNKYSRFFFMTSPARACNTTAQSHIESTFSPCHIVPVNDNSSHCTPLNDKMEKDFLRMDIDNQHSVRAVPSICISPNNHFTKKTKLNNDFENTLNCEVELSNANERKWTHPLA